MSHFSSVVAETFQFGKVGQDTSLCIHCKCGSSNLWEDGETVRHLPSPAAADGPRRLSAILPLQRLSDNGSTPWPHGTGSPGGPCCPVSRLREWRLQQVTHVLVHLVTEGDEPWGVLPGSVCPSPPRPPREVLRVPSVGRIPPHFRAGWKRRKEHRDSIPWTQGTRASWDWPHSRRL